ncbi:hypothetical protein LTR62_003911 [Meristemomyces frigidus]|uniref:Laccase n=1 Tax=Meristemomyces frigidus TaxID=1508187 RepID=A0AAN7TEY9_9PEZI|nr:hypothetical protein LTR62_003911 [Meristemomyces frigidus]
MAQFRLRPQDHIARSETTITLNWTITSGFRRPDGVLKRVHLVNDIFPGPIIEARSEDRLIVAVTNSLENEETLSIHWHGLSMRHANDQDGAVGVTSDPIAAGSILTYDFVIERAQHGTFWYHAHSALQRADGLFGGLVVHKPNNAGPRGRELQVEHLLLVQDWYHRSAQQALDFYTHEGGFGNEPVLDSVLANGKGVYNCSDAVPARPLDCVVRGQSHQTALQLDMSRKTLLRIVNVRVYAGIAMSIDGIAMKPVAVDGGNPVDATAARRLKSLHPGQRVDVLIKPDLINDPQAKPPRLEITLDSTTFKYPNPALTLTHHYPIKHPGTSKKRPNPELQAAEEQDLQTLRAPTAPLPPFPTKAQLTLLLYATTQKLAHLRNVRHGFINNTSFQPQTPPLLSLPRTEWNRNQFVPQIPYQPQNPVWVDIVLNNLDEEAHPFHFHGYDFYVLSTYSSRRNWGSFNPFADEEGHAVPPGGAYDWRGAVKRDTLLVPRRGYAFLRFRADNPGLWLLHCHVLWHSAMGMAMGFEIS